MVPRSPPAPRRPTQDGGPALSDRVEAHRDRKARPTSAPHLETKIRKGLPTLWATLGAIHHSKSSPSRTQHPTSQSPTQDRMVCGNYLIPPPDQDSKSDSRLLLPWSNPWICRKAPRVVSLSPPTQDSRAPFRGDPLCCPTNARGSPFEDAFEKPTKHVKPTSHPAVPLQEKGQPRHQPNLTKTPSHQLNHRKRDHSKFRTHPPYRSS